MESLTTQLGELFAAVQRSDVREVRRLVSAQVSPNQCNADGKTALMLASSIGNPEILRLLSSAAASSQAPARVFFKPGVAIFSDQLPSPLGALSGYVPLESDLAEGTYTSAQSYSTILNQQHPPTPLTDYVAAVSVFQALGSGQPKEKSQSLLSDPSRDHARDLPTPAMSPSVIEQLNRRPSELQSLEIQSLESPSLEPQSLEPQATPDIEALALESLLRGNIDELPAVSGAIESLDIPRDTAYEDIGPDAMLAEIEAIVRHAQTNTPVQPRKPVPIGNSPSIHPNGISKRKKSPATNPLDPDADLTFEDSAASAAISAQPAAQDINAQKLTPAEKGQTPLEIAVHRNDLDAVKALLKAGADFRPATWYDTPVLVTAAEKGYGEIVQLLIEKGANVNTGYEHLPLHIAAENGHMEIVQRLLRAGAYIHGQEEGGRTALIAAASAGHLPVVQLLIEKGANINDTSQGETPIMLAAKNGHQSVYEFLYSRLSHQSQMMMGQAFSGAALPENQAVPQPPTPAAPVPSHPQADAGLVQKQLIESAAVGHLPRLRAAIEAGADVNVVGRHNRTALSLAIQAGHMSLIEMLLDAHADPNYPDGTLDQPTRYPLMVAACSSSAIHRSDIIQVLVSQGARVDQTDEHGRTALMYATASTHIDAIAALVKAKADLFICDRTGRTALMMAEAGNHLPVIQLLRQAITRQRQDVALLKAVTQGNVDLVQRLLSTGGNPNATADGMTALSQAAAKGYVPIAQQLIKAGATLNYRVDESELNPLLYAAYRGHLAMVQMLISMGADVDVQVSGRFNALGYARLGQQQQRNAGKPFSAIIDLLIRHGLT